MSCHYEVVLWNPGRSGKAVHRKAPSLATAKMLGRALTQHMYGTSKISKFCEGQGKTESFPCSYWGGCSPNPSKAFGELEMSATAKGLIVAGIALAGGLLYVRRANALKNMVPNPYPVSAPGTPSPSAPIDSQAPYYVSISAPSGLIKPLGVEFPNQAAATLAASRALAPLSNGYVGYVYNYAGKQVSAVNWGGTSQL